jgi:carbamoylphosphate synthase large subunit
MHRSPIKPLRILFSEGSSLTAREFLSVLGPAGHHIVIVDPNPACICRFSRWTRRIHHAPAPGLDPMGYLAAVNASLLEGHFDVLLPTHEQAWLFAAGSSLLGPRARVAVAPAHAFSQVESKIEFARLLDDAGLPQPKWGLAASEDELEKWKPPFYLKAPFSTAGTGVRRVSNDGDAKDAFTALRTSWHEGPIMVQAVSGGPVRAGAGTFRSRAPDRCSYECSNGGRHRSECGRSHKRRSSFCPARRRCSGRTSELARRHNA